MPGAMSKPLLACPHGAGLKLHRGATFGEVSMLALQPRRPANRGFFATPASPALGYFTIGVPAKSALTCGRSPDWPDVRPFQGKNKSPPSGVSVRPPSKAGTIVQCSIGPKLGQASPGRGGARNSASRESYGLKPAQIENLVAAIQHAVAIGLPLTRFITVHWQSAGLSLAGMAKATGRLIDLLSKALKRHGYGSAWVWTHENGHGIGWHCHILAYVPAALVPRLTVLLRRWVPLITGKPYVTRSLHSTPIGGRLGLERSNPDLHRINLDTVGAYLLKQASPEAALQFALERLQTGGLIIGKRCGASQNICRKARKAKG